jgi:2'-5' RNA ligase
MPWDAPGSTAVVISTPEAEPLIGELSREHTPAGRDAMWPHVTLLVPFVRAEEIDGDVEARLAGALSRVEPFEYALVHPERFPDGVLYLAPEPAQPFVDLIQALVAAFPNHPPYDGAHETIVPHATVAVSDDEAFLARAAADLVPGLPVECRADSATLVERGSDLRWSLRRDYPIGAT